MSLRAKLILLITLLLVLLMLSGIDGARRMASINNAFKTTYNDRVVCLGQLNYVSIEIGQNLDTFARGITIGAEGNTDWDKVKASYDESHKRMVEQWHAYADTYLDSTLEVPLVNQAQPYIAQVDDIYAQMGKLLDARDTRGLISFINDRVIPFQGHLMPIVQKLIQVQLDVAKSNFDQSEINYQTSYVTTIVLIVLSLLFGIGLSGWVLLNLNRKVSSLHQVMAHAREHNDLTVRAAVAGQDEIDSISASYNALMENTRAFVEHAATAARLVADNTLGLADTSEQIRYSSALASESTNAMAAAVEEVTVSIAHVADNAHQARDLTTAARDRSVGGAEKIQSAVEKITDIDKSVTETARTVGKLGEDARHITAVVAVIKDVAEQTNLLALNAAIEAARAGEQGRGFAVVADEVRKLAERTASATIDIQKMVMQIGETSERAVEAMNNTVERTHECATLASEAGEAMQAIQQDVDAGEHAVSGIADALNEHRSGTQLIAQQVEKVAQATEKNTAAVATMSNTAESLKGMTAQLQAEINRFHYQPAA